MIQSEKTWNIFLKSLLIFLFFFISLYIFGNQKVSADAPVSLPNSNDANSDCARTGSCSGGGCGGSGGGGSCGGGGG